MHTTEIYFKHWTKMPWTARQGQCNCGQCTITWCQHDMETLLTLYERNPTVVCDSPLRWRHNARNSVSNHQPHDCLLNRIFRRRSKKISKLRVTGLCAGSPVNSPHKWPLTRKMFPFDDVIMHNKESINRNFDISLFPLLRAWTTCWINSRVTGDLKHLNDYV